MDFLRDRFSEIAFSNASSTVSRVMRVPRFFIVWVGFSGYRKIVEKNAMALFRSKFGYYAQDEDICFGLGAGDLFGKHELYPGQMLIGEIILKAPETTVVQ